MSLSELVNNHTHTPLGDAGPQTPGSESTSGDAWLSEMQAKGILHHSGLFLSLEPEAMAAFSLETGMLKYNALVAAQQAISV